jgi:glycosyltransferase involved in cell wall biosynthesis
MLACNCWYVFLVYKLQSRAPDDTLFVPKDKDASTIAKYLDRLVEDREFRSDLARSERKWILENYDTSRIVGKWRTLLESVTKEGISFSVKDLNPEFNC